MKELFVNQKYYYKIDKGITFFICFISKFLIAKDQIMINTLSDEVSSMSIAAFLAGYDWRDVISNAGYYGIGYLFIFFPLFKFGLSSIQIYRIILATNAVVIGITGIICYLILKNIFEIESRIAKITIACTCGCMSIFSTSITRARNEDIYILCGWLFAYLLLRLLGNEEARKRKKYEIQVIVLMLYMLTIHSRSIVYFLSIIVVSVIYYFLESKVILSKKNWCFLAIGYIGVQQLLELYQKCVWNSEVVRNASLGDTVSSSISQLTIDINMIKSIFMIIFGQFFTAFSLSGGIFLICFVIVFLFAYKVLKCRYSIGSIGDVDSIILVFSMFFLFAILISIGGQSILWGVNVYKGLITGANEYIYAYKAFTYMRYMGSYVPQFMMIALVIGWKEINLWGKACKLTMPIFIVLLLFWMKFIIPFVENTKSNMEFFLAIISLPQETKNNIEIWQIMFLILFLLMFIWIFRTDRKAFICKLIIIGILYTNIERCMIFYNKVLYSEEIYLERVDKGCEVLEVLHDRLKSKEQSICVVDITENRTDHQNWYLYQFLNYDLHIIPGTKEKIIETDIIFSTHEISDLLQEEYDGFQIDKNEYVYSKNIEYSNKILMLGGEILE